MFTESVDMSLRNASAVFCVGFLVFMAKLSKFLCVLVVEGEVVA